MNTTKNNKSNKLALLISCALPLAIAGIIIYLLPKPNTVLSQLNTPAFLPPAWLFPIAWTILYILMGTAAWRIYAYQQNTTQGHSTLKLYLLQLFFNFLWPIAFFGLQNLAFSLVIILILLGLVIATSYKMYQQDHLSGILFIPYVFWVTFASALNFAIWYLN